MMALHFLLQSCITADVKATRCERASGSRVRVIRVKKNTLFIDSLSIIQFQ